MLYDILDFIEELFWEQKWKKFRQIFFSILVFLIMIFSFNIVIFLTDNKIREIKNEKEIYFQKTFFDNFNSKVYLVNYKVSFFYKNRINLMYKYYLMSWKKSSDNTQFYYVFIVPYKKNESYIPKRMIVYVNDLNDVRKLDDVDKSRVEKEILEVKLIRDEEDFKIKKMLNFLEKK